MSTFSWKSLFLCTIICDFLCTNIILVSAQYSKYDLRRLHRCEADVTLAGLFPISSRENNNHDRKKTNKSWDRHGVQEALAMIYSVYKINKRNDILPNVTLGVDLLDTHDQSDRAIRSCLQFDFVRAQRAAANKQGLNSKQYNSSTVAVIGLRKSSVARSVATLTQLFNVPSISYGSRDHTLSDSQFPYFARTIPNNRQLVKVVFGLLRKLEWNIVFVLYNDQTDYGRSAFQLFQEEHRQRGKICIAWSSAITENSFEATLLKMKNDVIPKFPMVSALVVFAHRKIASLIITHASCVGIVNITWIVTSNIDMEQGFINFLKTNPYTIITLNPKVDTIDQNSYTDFVTQTLHSEQMHTLAPDLRECHKGDCLYIEGDGSPFLSHLLCHVIDAVNVVAHALHSLLKCDDGQCNLSRLKSAELWNHITNVSFLTSSNYTLKLNKNGEIMAQYQIDLLKKNNSMEIETLDGIHKKSVGIWDSCKGKFLELTDSIRNLTKSSCRQRCWPGEVQVQCNVFESCCNSCKRCPKKKYTNRSNAHTCKTCPAYYTANEKQSGCVPMQEIFIKNNSVMGITLISLACTGLIAVLLTGRVFYQNRETHIIRASSCEVSMLMLVGAFACFASPFIIIEKITNFKCKLTVMTSGVAFSLMIGGLLVKTNRVYRIFNKDILRKGLPRFLSIFWQRAILSVIIILDSGLSIVIAYYPNDDTRFKVLSTSSGVYSVCYYNTSLVSVWWVFNCSLVSFCTYQAILARKVPGNYNEARNIMLSMLAISLEIIILLPSFYYQSTGFNRQLILTFINMVSAASTMCFMFLPKLYVVFFRPWENREELPHGHMGFFLREQDSITSTNTMDSNSSESSRYTDKRKKQNNCCRKKRTSNKSEHD